ncbi:MAG: hypothetical protein PUB90_05060, partial [bacterium]|nr:hypothetical protein [bacterium]
MNLILPIYSVFLLILLIVVYFSKERIKTDETKLYCILIFLSVFNITFNIIGIYLGYYDGESSFLYMLNHLDLPLYYWWASILCIYFLYALIGKNNELLYEKIKSIIITLNIIFTTLTLFLPFKIVINEKAGYAIGACVNFVYAISALYLVISIIISLLLIKRNNLKKTIPVFSLLLLGVAAALIQKNIPSLIIVPSMAVFVELIMYHTIENPDVKLLKEMHDAKVISDNANEEKTMFLYNMTQEIRKTTKNIDVEADNILESKDLELDKDSARNIKVETSKFTTMTNDILDVSTIDSSNIKIYNTKYNIKTILKEVVSNYKTISMNKGIEFRTNIEHNIPDILYGDGIELKKVLTLLLNESIKNTDKGYIELNINTIIKNEIMRLIITI